MLSVKELVESGSLLSIPPKYIFPKKPEDFTISDAEEIPIIDFSLLASGSTDQRSRVIQELGNACLDWGFFMVINHGIPKKLIDEMVKASESFFDLKEEIKQEYKAKELFDPVRYGTGFNGRPDEALYWRDYLKIQVHPTFHAPNEPACFKEISEEFCRRSREVASVLLKGISRSLGLEEDYIHKAMELEVGSQLLVVNLYPPCPEPEAAVGMPPHSDFGLLALLAQNEVCGLQVLHRGKWVPVNSHPNFIVVNIGDHLEILTNGRYKSVLHRAMVNQKATRISVGTAIGPPKDVVVGPARELVDSVAHPPAFRPIKYGHYFELQQSNRLDGKSCLDRIRIE